MRLNEIADRLLPLVQELCDGSHEQGGEDAATILLAVWHYCERGAPQMLHIVAVGVDRVAAAAWDAANKKSGS